MDINNLLSTFASLGTIGKALINERDRQKLATLQINLSESLIKAQSQLQQILATVTEKERSIYILEQRVRELEAQQAEKSRYKLTKLGTVRQFFAYTLTEDAKPLEGAGEDEHFLCQPCFDGGKKVVLIGNGEGYWQCPVCKVGAQTTPDTFDYERFSSFKDRGCY